MLYLPSTISITNLALPVEEPTIDDDVDGAVKGGTTSDDVECGVDDGDGSEVCGGGTMGGGLISDKGDGAGVDDGDGDGDDDVWIGWVGDGTDCTTGRKILDESRPCPCPRPPSCPRPPPPRPRPLCAIYCTQSKYIEHIIEI